MVSGIALDTNGNIFVTDNLQAPGISQLIKISEGTKTTLLSNLNYPNGIRVDASGDLFFSADYNPGALYKYATACNCNEEYRGTRIVLV